MERTLEEWWEVMEDYLAGTGVNVSGLRWEEYHSIFRKVYRAMVPAYVEEEANESVREDWENDSEGLEFLPISKVKDAVFELAEVWTTGSTPDECASFLHDLLSKICARGPDGKARLLADDDIPVGIGMELERTVPPQPKGRAMEAALPEAEPEEETPTGEVGDEAEPLRPEADEELPPADLELPPPPPEPQRATAAPTAAEPEAPEKEEEQAKAKSNAKKAPVAPPPPPPPPKPPPAEPAGFERSDLAAGATEAEETAEV